jgi:hypothetical protein
MLFESKKQITKPLRCADCGADMHFLASHLNGRVFLSTILERNFFVCSDCGRLSYEIVAWPKEFIRFEAVQISQVPSRAMAVDKELARRWEQPSQPSRLKVESRRAT